MESVREIVRNVEIEGTVVTIRPLNYGDQTDLLQELEGSSDTPATNMKALLATLKRAIVKIGNVETNAEEAEKFVRNLHPKLVLLLWQNYNEVAAEEESRVEQILKKKTV